MTQQPMDRGEKNFLLKTPNHLELQQHDQIDISVMSPNYNINTPITIRVRDPSGGQETFVNSKPLTKMERMFSMYSQSKNVEVHDLRFFKAKDGKKVEGNQTPDELLLDDMDLINVMPNNNLSEEQQSLVRCSIGFHPSRYSLSDDRMLTIRLRGQDGIQRRFPIRGNQPLQTILDLFADRVRVDVDHLYLLLDGERILSTETPNRYDLDNDDQVDVMMLQGGC